MAVLDGATLRSELERGLTLPASWYSDPHVLALEQERIFARSWQYAGVVTQVERPGSFFTCQAGTTPVVVIRGRDEELRAFVNVCRHRGHEVASGCGRRETLQCPYHAWTYDLDGALRAAPRADREPGFDLADWSLLPVQVATFGPLVFVNPAADAPPLETVLGNVPASLVAGGIQLDELEYTGRSREFVVEANWKLVVENYLECYHCPVAHQSFSRLIDVDPDAYTLTTDRWSSSQHGPVQLNGRDLPYEPAGAIQASQFHFIWPNWTLNTFPGPANVRVLVFEPRGPDRTATYVDGFWAPGTSEQVIAEMTEFGTAVGLEDIALVESVHRGLRTGTVPQGRLLLDSEHLLQHFQLLVHDALAG
jgi:phenylpropionate dioxygenase-like ring-hydroxylating dioxygenase large terminal subunit